MPPDVERNEAVVNAAVSAASAGGDWRAALRIIDEALGSALTPRSSSFNMAIGCAAAAGSRDASAAALALLRRMRAAHVKTNLLTCARSPHDEPSHTCT